MERPNIYAVAARAGVSITTVSRVLNGKGPVARRTREQVLAAIRELGYQPSWLGRALAGRGQAALGIVFPDLAGPYHAEVIAGMESLTAAQGQALLILGTHGRDRCDEMVLDFARRVDGLVVTARTIPDAEVARLQDGEVRVVLLGRPPVNGAPAVRTENFAPALKLTTHLIADHGHRRLRFVGDPALSPDVAERWEGFVQAHRDAGLSAPRSPVRANLRQEDGYLAARRLLGGASRPGALVCANDEMALGVYAAAAEAGVRIPQDLAVTGWDDIPLVRYAVPPLTTVHQPVEELGRRAADTLVRRILGEEVPEPDLVLPSSPVFRESCGCRPGG